MAQKPTSKLDSALFKWRSVKTYKHRVVQVSLGGGSFLPLAGNTFEVLKVKYNGYISEFFGTELTGYPPSTEISNKGANLALEFKVNNRFTFGAALLPSQHKCFEGGGGQNYTIVNSGWWLSSSSTHLLEGYKVEEHIFSNSVGLTSNYTIIPFKRLRKIGLELRGGLNVILNRIQVVTDLKVWDDNTDASGNIIVTSSSAHYSEIKILPGIYSNLRLDVFLGKGFSFFGQIYGGGAAMMDIKEKSLTHMTQTAKVPQHKEGIKGFGFVWGIAIHMGSVIYDPKNKVTSAGQL